MPFRVLKVVVGEFAAEATRPFASCSGTRFRRRSASPYGLDDLHPIAFAQRVSVMQAARHDFAIDLDRDAALGVTRIREQGGNGGGRRAFARGAVQDDLHPCILTPCAEHPRCRRSRVPLRGSMTIVLLVVILLFLLFLGVRRRRRVLRPLLLLSRALLLLLLRTHWRFLRLTLLRPGLALL